MNSKIKGALTVLAVFAVTAAIQRHVMPIPVVGAYLPR